MLKIWNRADPTTTNRNTPNMMGPICALSSFFWVNVDDYCLAGTFPLKTIRVMLFAFQLHLLIVGLSQ